MDSDGSGDGVFHHQGACGSRIMTSSPSSGMVVNSTSDKVSGVTLCSESIFRVDPFYGSNNWDLLVSLNNQTGTFGDSAMAPPNEFAHYPHSSVLLENHAHLAHIPSHSGLVDMLPKIPGFGSENFFSQSDFANKRWAGTHIPSTSTADSQDHCQNSDDRRKRKASLAASPQNAAEKQQKDPSVDTSELPKEDDEKRQKFEGKVGQKSQSKQAKDFNGAEPSKENYIHVRAKRGQATNSHSLAERVRRERISERMKLLQELVPGCNKITGKAMMLDEIINYVQSLQQQVEFLSMKLATVNPELDLDLDRILPKEILHFCGNDTTAPGVTSGLSSLHRFPGYPFDSTPTTTPPFPPPPQHLWNNELQGVLHTGFDPDPSSCSLGSNGLSKTEL